MRIVLWLAIAASLYGGWQWWQDRPGAALAGIEPSPNGFVPVEMPSGAPRNAVLVLAPPNCTAEQRRGVDLAIDVFNQGAPAVFINGMAMSNPSVDQAVAEYRRTRRGG